MLSEPVEAEMAMPPIYTNTQEKRMGEADVEPSNRSSVATLAGDVDTFRSTSGDVESGKRDKVIVAFEPGTGENPREWSKAKKW